MFFCVFFQTRSSVKTECMKGSKKTEILSAQLWDMTNHVLLSFEVLGCLITELCVIHVINSRYILTVMLFHEISRSTYMTVVLCM